MKDPETEYDFNAINEEEETLSKVIGTINTQITAAKEKHRIEEDKARELTSEIVSLRRAEEKALLASDEAVAHAMRDSKRDQVTDLLKQLKKPYFARVKVEEEHIDSRGNESTKKFEYRIGYKTNLDSRIIDWRTAPIAKLYYEYKEGDEYSEVIQGVERLGTITLRNRVEINSGELKKFTTTKASYVKTDTGWKKTENTNERNFARSYSQLPPILSLITAEQFKLITEGADLPVFIQGIAGSGKTVVALHRISWLLLEKNLEAKNCLILVKSPLLNSYIKNSCSLIDSDLEEIHTFKFDEWVEKCLGTLIQNNTENPDNITNQNISTPRSIFRLKNSSGFIHSLKNELKRAKERTDNLDLNLIKAIYLKALSDHRTIIDNDETKLINKELVDNSLKYTTEQFEKNYFSSLDKVIFLLIKQELSSQFENHLQQKNRYEHIFTDEVQDFSLPELLVIMNSVKEKNSLTMVGDVSQSLTDSFPGWNKVLKIWGEIHSSSNTSIGQQTNGQQLNEKNIIKLSVSHRSTAQIMQLAEYVRDSRRAEIIAQKSPKEGVRIGRVPIWFRCPNEQKAFSAMSDWVLKAQEKYPNSATAILCKDRATAKYLAKLLEPRFGASVRLVDDNTTTIEEGLLVAQIADIKGLEFFNVLLWNPSKRNYNDQIIDRNLLYTAITRAEENLAIVSYERESEFLPKFSGVGTNNGNELVRGFDLREEEEEN